MLLVSNHRYVVAELREAICSRPHVPASAATDATVGDATPKDDSDTWRRAEAEHAPQQIPRVIVGYC